MSFPEIIRWRVHVRVEPPFSIDLKCYSYRAGIIEAPEEYKQFIGEHLFTFGNYLVLKHNCIVTLERLTGIDNKGNVIEAE